MDDQSMPDTATIRFKQDVEVTLPGGERVIINKGARMAGLEWNTWRVLLHGWLDYESRRGIRIALG